MKCSKILIFLSNSRIYKIAFLFLLIGFFSFSLSATPAQIKYSEVRIFIVDKTDIFSLQNSGLQFDHIRRGQNYFDVVLDEKEIEILQSSGMHYQILIDDVVTDYLNKTAMSPAELKTLEKAMKERYSIEGFGFGSMGGFYTFDEVVAELDSMRLLYPNLMSVRQSIGTSSEGRDLWMVKISDNPDINEQEPEILYDAVHHAREPESMMVLMYFMYYLLENYGSDPEVTDLVDSREFYFIPIVNPDGYVYNQFTDPNGGGMWRKNRRDNGDGTFGVDLNRNYGYEWGHDNSGSSPNPSDNTYRGTAPFSEPEIQAVRDFCLSHDFKLNLSYHCHGDWLLYPWGYAEHLLTPDSTIFIDLATDMTQFNNYVYGTIWQTLNYIGNGGAFDWMYGEQTLKNKIISMTPEVGPAFWPSQSQIFPLAQENVYPNLVIAHGAGVILADALDPNSLSNVIAYSDFSTPTSTLLTWNDPSAYTNGDTLTDFTIEIYRDTAFIAAVLKGTETYQDTGLIDGQYYLYKLYAKDINDSLSQGAGISIYAGGALKPNPPINFYITKSNSELTMHWTNPVQNVDGTPMDDFAGINLYRNDTLVSTFNRSPVDTGITDLAQHTAPTGMHRYHLSAFDNEIPANESEPGNVAYSPLNLPFFDDFPATPVANSSFWINTNAEVNNVGINPPSPPYVLSLDGHPEGGDVVELYPIDLSGFVGSQAILSYWYQPEGSGNDPEAGDQLYLDFLNNLGQWINIRIYPGTPMVPFVNEIIDIGLEDPGSGASFFHHGFQLRFYNTGSSSTTNHYDHWLIDDVSIEVIPTGIEAEKNIPTVFFLKQNYPNPFNPRTTIEFGLPKTEFVTLKIYNILGQEVKTLVADKLSVGKHKYNLDASGFASGVYYYKITAGNFMQTKKLLFLQ